MAQGLGAAAAFRQPAAASVGFVVPREAPWRRRFRAPRVTFPSWALDAPDRLVYGSNQSGKWELYAWDRGSDTHRQVTDRPEGTLTGAPSRSGDHIWWFDDVRGNEFGRWMIEPFEVGGSRLAVPELAPAYSAGLAAGRRVVVVGSSTDDGTRIDLVVDGDGPTRLYEHVEDANVGGLSRDERLVCISHSEHGDSRHPALRVVDLDGATVAELWDGPGRGLWPGGWSAVEGDRRMVVVHERADLLRPLIWDVGGDQVEELPFDLPGEVEASWYPDGSALLIHHDHRGRGELYRFDLSTRALDPIEAPRGSVGGARVRPDGEVWFAWSSSSTPPEVRGPAGTVLRPPGERAPGGVAYSDLDVGGVHAFIAEPPGDRPHPTIFEVHGGPTWHDSDAFSPLVQAWVDHGFAVVLVNYRGSTGYGRQWRDALEGNPGLTELEDIAAVRRRVVEDGIADPDRLVLAGGSWGGYLTLLGLGTQPGSWSLGVGAVPVADYIAAYEDEMEPLKAFDRSLFGGSPQDIPREYEKRSPITYVDAVRVPVMILAGENDPRCPIRQIDNYIARLAELGTPHEVYRYEAGHGSLLIDETVRQVEAQLAFVAKHLGTPPPR